MFFSSCGGGSGGSMSRSIDGDYDRAEANGGKRVRVICVDTLQVGADETLTELSIAYSGSLCGFFFLVVY
nr:hypothetical protein CFP56_37945 [Quercus suber]